MRGPWARIRETPGNSRVRRIGSQDPAGDYKRWGELRDRLCEALDDEGIDYKDPIVTHSNLFPDDQPGVPISVSIEIPDLEHSDITMIRMKYPELKDVTFDMG